jgi:flagellar M-ring protein FliF
VTVLDEKGDVLNGGEDGGGQLDAQQALEKTLGRRVKEVLERLVGAGKVAVVVTAELDFAKTDRTEESFDKDNTALRSESRTEERAGGGAGGAASGGVAGVRGNLPGAPAGGGGAASDPNVLRSSETRNFEVNRVVSRIVGPAMKLKQLHVAVLVDQPAAGPRAPEDLARISALAREAAGLSKERGDSLEVHSAPFAPEPKDDERAPAPLPLLRWPPPIEMLVAGGAALLVLIVAGVALAAMRRRGRRRGRPDVLPALPASVGAVEAALPDGTPAAALPGLPAPSARERALAAASADAARAARILSSWLDETVAEGARS